MYLRGSITLCTIATISVALGQEPASQFPWKQAPRPVTVRTAQIPATWEAATEAATSSAAIERDATSSHTRTGDFEDFFPQSTLPPVERRNNLLSHPHSLTVDQQVNANKPKVVQVQVRPRKADSDNSASTMKGAYKTESYTAPLVTGEQLFASLKISDSYQNAGGVLWEETQPDSLATPFTWASPVFAHRPLYFEQPNLERYGIGHRKCAQPIFSGLHFYGSVFLLPYKMVKQPPCEESYTLGHQRPGSYVAFQRGSILGL